MVCVDWGMDEESVSVVPESPVGYGSAERFVLPVGVVNVVALVLAVGGFVGFGAVAVAVHGSGAFSGVLVVAESADGVAFTVNVAAVAATTVVAVVGTVVLHEALHGLVFSSFGYEVTYGVATNVGGFFAAAFGQYVSWGETVWALVAPLVVLDVLALLLLVVSPNGFVSLFAWLVVTMNTAGAAADLWVLGRLLRLPRETVFCDVDLRHSYYFEKES